MRKIFITGLIISGFYSVSNAQAKPGTLDFGANIGLNEGALIENGTAFTYTPLLGFNAAASLEYYFSDRWSFKGKLIFDQKGWSNSYAYAGEENGVAIYPNVNFNLNYLTVPLMANWHFGKTRSWYLHFGPYIGFLLSDKDVPDNVVIKPTYNTIDVGLDLGIGVKFPVSKTFNLFLEADGQGGFINIFKGTNDGSSVQNDRSSLNFGFNIAIN
jgi:hypothetical protein